MDFIFNNGKLTGYFIGEKKNGKLNAQKSVKIFENIYLIRKNIFFFGLKIKFIAVFLCKTNTQLFFTFYPAKLSTISELTDFQVIKISVLSNISVIYIHS